MAKKELDNNAIVVDLGAPNSDPQWRFFNSKVRYTCYGGARGGGKSWAIIRKAVLLALCYRGRSCCRRIFETTTRRNTF